jgi:negative regulator of flagellin synthesis FlgM
MRIDLNTSIGQTPDAAEATQSTLKSSSSPAGRQTPSNVASLSSDYVKVGALTAAISGLPEIRQDKVAALSESIRSGTYAVSAEQMAEALLSHAEATA